MAPEIESSSSAQNSDEPRGLVHILLAFFSGALFVSLLSRWHAPDRESLDSNRTQDSTSEERERRQYVSQSPVRVAIESFPPAKTPPEERKREKQKKKRFKWYGLAVNLGTLGAVIWYACIATQQRDQMIEQATLTKQVAKLAYGPAVNLNEWIGLSNFGEEKIPYVLLKLQNDGKSKALEIRVNAEIKILPRPPTNYRQRSARLVTAAIKDSKTLLPLVEGFGPYIGFRQDAVEKISSTEYASYKSGDTNLYIWGQITYHDINGMFIPTDFCRYVSIAQVQNTGEGPKAFSGPYDWCPTKETNPQ